MPHIFESGIVNAPVGKVWPVLRDFSGVKNFSDDILSSDIEGMEHPAGGRVGMVRRMIFRDGSEMRERLAAISDRQRYLAYTILSPDTLPICDYVGRITVLPVSDGTRSIIGWSGTFLVARGSPDDITEWLRDGYRAGIRGMCAYIERL